ncbi:hypothetical protein [Methylobacterium sp. ID0610]|uniref:hypothetical protein n=1 Tax=Methylobacterium carpenticola TaxID=3344827 RepID=UPI00367AFD8D
MARDLPGAAERGLVSAQGASRCVMMRPGCRPTRLRASTPLRRPGRSKPRRAAS